MEQFVRLKVDSRYGISPYGNVKNLETGRIMKQSIKHGSAYVQLRYITYPVAKLVADTFKRSPKENEILVHIDGNSLNNELNNLEYMDKTEYQRQLYSQGKNRGHHAPQKRPVVINETGEEFESMSACARYLGVAQSTVADNVEGRTKTCQGYTISFCK